MKNKQIAAVLFSAGLAIAGMTAPASAAPADFWLQLRRKE